MHDHTPHAHTHTLLSVLTTYMQ